MLAVAWEMEGEDGSINIENYVKSCIENEKFSDLLTVKILDVFVSV